MTSRRPSTLQEELTLGMPSARGLYDPRFEHDSCGVGFVCDIKGVARNQIVRAAEHINCCMVHRGGVGYEKNTGDGAGILTALPHKLFAKFSKRAAEDQSCRSPAATAPATSSCRARSRNASTARTIIEERIKAEGQVLLGWRKVPVDPGRRRSRQGRAARDADDRATVHRRRATASSRTRSNASST